MYREIKKCILCHSELTQVLDLGNQYVVDFVKEKDEKLLKAPLVLMNCKGCNLIQMKYRVSPDRLYKKFWYRSGMNEQMKNELLAIVQKAQEVVELNNGDKVLDIGCNDGTLLGWYDKRITTVGVDPCDALVKEGLKAGKIDIGINDYFTKDAMKYLCKAVGVNFVKFKIITAIAMFYDLEDPVEFLKDCKDVLHNEGVLIIQMNYLVSMLKDDAFDFICHEHLALYSVLTLEKAIKMAGLDLVGIELSSSNGGSIRAYVTHPGFDKFGINNHENKLWLSTNASFKMMEEMRMGLDRPDVYKAFEHRVAHKMSKLRTYLSELKDEGKEIYAYGASTRGTVLMQYLFNGMECFLKGVAERDEHKYGLKMVGTWLPIMPEEEVRNKATHMLVLPWHFESSIVKREKEWINQRKGKLIFPLPEPHLAQLYQDDVMMIDTGVKL